MSQPLQGERRVAQGVYRLHAGDDVELAKAREVPGDHLGVLYAVAPRAVSALRRGDGVERDAIGAVTDGVDRQLQAARVHLASTRREVSSSSSSPGLGATFSISATWNAIRSSRAAFSRASIRDRSSCSRVRRSSTNAPAT